MQELDLGVVWILLREPGDRLLPRTRAKQLSSASHFAGDSTGAQQVQRCAKRGQQN